MATKTLTINISGETYQRLEEKAIQAGKSLEVLVQEAVIDLSMVNERELIADSQKEQFLERVCVAFATLRGNPQAWKEELAERQAWENTLADGL